MSDVDLTNVCGARKIVQCSDWSRTGAATGVGLSLIPNTFVWGVNALGGVRTFPPGTGTVITTAAAIAGHFIGKKYKTCSEVDPNSLHYED